MEQNEISKELLRKIGLTKAETEVYIALLKSEQMIASEIVGHVNMQRPNVYDALERLKEKGLVSYVIKNNLKYFKAASPDKLKDYVDGLKKDLDEKESQITALIPELKKLGPFIKSKISVEVYEGKEGIRTVLFDSIKETKETKKEILGIGINNQKIIDQDTIYYQRYTKEREKIKSKSRYLVLQGMKIFVHKDTEIKTLPKEFESPTATFIYGNKVSIWLWFDVPVVIVMSSKEVADSYRSYFDGLWMIAKN